MKPPSPSGYFECSRADVAGLVPGESRRILEVGAGFGSLGRILAQREAMVLDAVELNPAAAPHLEGVYRSYWIGDVQSLELAGALPEYDCLIFPDVLEHLVDPWSVIERLCVRLRPGGHVVASLPNVRNIAVLYRLLVQGRWDYEDSGVLDRTHLRFFTRGGIADLIEGAGLSIERWEANRDSYSGARRVVAAAAKLFSPDIDVCQYLVLARKP